MARKRKRYTLDLEGLGTNALATLWAAFMQYGLGVYMFWNLSWLEAIPSYDMVDRLVTLAVFVVFFGLAKVMLAELER